MTTDAFAEAITARLRTAWPDQAVYTQPPPSGSDNCFFVSVTGTSGVKLLGRRRKRTYRFEVQYFPQGADTTVCQAWADAMYDLFETLDVADGTAGVRRVHLSNQQAQRGDTASYRFMFEAVFTAVYAGENEDAMETAIVKEATIS